MQNFGNWDPSSKWVLYVKLEPLGTPAVTENWLATNSFNFSSIRGKFKERLKLQKWEIKIFFSSFCSNFEICKFLLLRKPVKDTWQKFNLTLTSDPGILDQEHQLGNLSLKVFT